MSISPSVRDLGQVREYRQIFANSFLGNACHKPWSRIVYSVPYPGIARLRVGGSASPDDGWQLWLGLPVVEWSDTSITVASRYIRSTQDHGLGSFLATPLVIGDWRESVIGRDCRFDLILSSRPASPTRETFTVPRFQQLSNPILTNMHITVGQGY